MKRTLIASITLLFASCGVSYQYTGTIKQESRLIDSTGFKNDLVKIQFQPLKDRISFGLVNSSPDPISILWDNTTIAINGKTQPVTHGGVVIRDRMKEQRPSTVPPGMQFNDYLIPSNNIYYVSGDLGGGYVEDLFKPGSRVDLNLAINAKDSIKYLYFTFEP